jgi:thiamine biosynthesis lipoprotein
MQIFRFPFKAMACTCEVVLAQTEVSKAQLLANKAISEVQRIEEKYSRYRDESIVSQINQAAGANAIKVDAETWTLLQYADTLYRSSEGMFDITAGILRRAWNFSLPTLPSELELQAVCTLIDWNSVELQNQEIRLPKAGMEIDFGGFGKEYAADRAALILTENGIDSGYVNLGGDIRILGPKPDGQAWQFGIQDPRHIDQLVATIPIERGALATSGDYQRYFDLDGQRYCHILDPYTGRPVQHWRSITVMAPLATMAGSCTTIGMLLQTEAIGFLEKANVRFLAIDYQGKLYKSSSMPS